MNYSFVDDIISYLAITTHHLNAKTKSENYVFDVNNTSRDTGMRNALSLLRINY